MRPLNTLHQRTTNQRKVYEAPRPSGVPGASAGFTTSGAYGGFAGATDGPAGGQIGGTVVPTKTAASGAASGAYSGASGIASGSAAPTAGDGVLAGSYSNNAASLQATYGPGGPGGCGGGQVGGKGTTLCVKRREAMPTA